MNDPNQLQYLRVMKSALPEGAATQATLELIQSELKAIHDSLAKVQLLTGSTIPVSIQQTELPSGSATSSLQTTGNAFLSAINSKVSTEAKQDTGNTSLTSIDGKLPALSSGKVPVIGPLTDTQLRATAVPVSAKIWDTVSSTYVGLKFNSEAPQVCSQDYLQAICEGDIASHLPFDKFGRVTGVTTAEVGVWDVGTAFNLPPSATKMDVTGGAQDTAAGTGVQKIKILGLNSSYVEVTEEVTMNGATIVTTSNSFLRIEKTWASQVGGNKVAAGNIELKGTGGATVYGRIPTGLTQSRSARYTVPAGKTLYITSISISSGVGNTTASGKYNYVTATIRVTKDPGTGALSTIFYPVAEIGVINSAIVRPFEMPIKCPAESDVIVVCIGDTAQAVTVTAAMRGWIE